MLGYLSAEIFCTDNFFFFFEFWDKCPSIFSCQVEAIVFIILQIFFATRAVLKIGEYHSQFWLVHIKSREAFRPTENMLLCSWARHFTLTVPLSTQVYKWVPVNLMLEGNPAMD